MQILLRRGKSDKRLRGFHCTQTSLVTKLEYGPFFFVCSRGKNGHCFDSPSFYQYVDVVHTHLHNHYSKASFCSSSRSAVHEVIMLITVLEHAAKQAAAGFNPAFLYRSHTHARAHTQVSSSSSQTRPFKVREHFFPLFSRHLSITREEYLVDSAALFVDLPPDEPQALVHGVSVTWNSSKISDLLRKVNN